MRDLASFLKRVARKIGVANGCREAVVPHGKLAVHEAIPWVAVIVSLETRLGFGIYSRSV